MALYALSIGLGLYLAAERGWGLLGIGAVGLVLSLAYSAPPLRLVHRGLGEPVTALGFGPVMAVGTYFACTGRWSWQPVLASLPVALLIALVLYVNQIPDRVGDAAAGKRTLIVRFSRLRSQAGYAVTVAAAYVCIVAEVGGEGHAGVDPARLGDGAAGVAGAQGAARQLRESLRADAHHAVQHPPALADRAAPRDRLRHRGGVLSPRGPAPVELIGLRRPRQD